MDVKVTMSDDDLQRALEAERARWPTDPTQPLAGEGTTVAELIDRSQRLRRRVDAQLKALPRRLRP